VSDSSFPVAALAEEPAAAVTAPGGFTGSEFALIAVAKSRPDAKPFLGGFRDKRTGTEFHHASSQTPRAEAWGKSVADKQERETQTVQETTTGYQPPKEMGTQVDRPGVFRNRRDTDRVVVRKVGQYVPFAELHINNVAQLTVIQRIARGWLARRRVRKMKEAKERDLAERVETEKELEQLRRVNFQQELDRKRNPRTRADFEQLYSELEEWCQQEKRRINEAFAGDAAGRKKALREHLHQQTRVIQTIDRLKAQAAVQKREQGNRKKLKEVSRANRAVRADGTLMKVHNDETLHAKSLRKLYEALVDPLPMLDARLDILLQVKTAVEPYDCELTDDIVDLIERESETLSMGRSERTLTGVRKRLGNLFLQFVETPEFNPAAARSGRVPAKRTSTLGAPTRSQVLAQEHQ
jgi:hypothetical protein